MRDRELDLLQQELSSVLLQLKQEFENQPE